MGCHGLPRGQLLECCYGNTHGSPRDYKRCIPRWLLPWYPTIFPWRPAGGRGRPWQLPWAPMGANGCPWNPTWATVGSHGGSHGSPRHTMAAAMGGRVVEMTKVEEKAAHSPKDRFAACSTLDRAMYTLRSTLLIANEQPAALIDPTPIPCVSYIHT